MRYVTLVTKYYQTGELTSIFCHTMPQVTNKKGGLSYEVVS